MGLLYIYNYNIYLSKTTTLGTIRGITKVPDAIAKNIKTGTFITQSHIVLTAYNNYVLCDASGIPLC